MTNLFSERGQAMILTIVVLGGSILSATVIGGLLLSYQIRQSTDMASSGRSIFAADAGLEIALYRYFRDRAEPWPTFSNGATVVVTCYDSAGTQLSDCTADEVSVLRSKGSSGNVSRAFELSF